MRKHLTTIQDLTDFDEYYGYINKSYSFQVVGDPEEPEDFPILVIRKEAQPEIQAPPVIVFHEEMELRDLKEMRDNLNSFIEEYQRIWEATHA